MRLGVLPHAGGRGEPAARAWLADRLGVAPPDVPLARDGHGRPCLGMPGRDCNWSHSGDRLVVARADGARVGVDVEVARPRPKALEIARRYFHDDEAAALAELSPVARDHAFLRLWCAKEAVLKAHGHGLSFGLEKLRFRESADALVLVECDPGLGCARDWTLHEFVPATDYVAALAWR